MQKLCRLLPAFLATALILGASPVWAQGTTSRLTGVVSDASGGRIPGAAVTFTHEGTGVASRRSRATPARTRSKSIQVGTYTVRVELQGFKTYESTGNVVRIGEPKTVNAVLETGTLAETVQVVGGSETVQLSTSGNFGSVIDQRAIETLPIVGTRGRNPLSLVTTQPGVVSGANTGGGVHVNGARDRSWNFTLDGIDVNETSAGGSNFAPLRTNPDSLAEFKVLTGNTTAEFGRNSGGQVAMISRSGTNRFQGTGFYFGRRPEFNANEWEFNIDDLPKREFVQDIYGFSIGGPIKRNKAFFFSNVQILRAEQTQTRTRTVYTQNARDGLWRYVVGGRNGAAGAGERLGRRERQCPARPQRRHLQHPGQRPPATRHPSRHQPRRRADAAAQQLHGRRRPQHRRLHLRPARERGAVRPLVQGGLRLQPAALHVRALLEGRAEHDLRRGQRRLAALPRTRRASWTRSAIRGTSRPTGAGTRRRTW